MNVNNNEASADVLDTIVNYGGWLTVARISRETGRDHHNVRKVLDRLRRKGLVEQRWTKTSAGRLAVQVHMNTASHRWLWARDHGLPPDTVLPLMRLIRCLAGHDHPEHWSPDIDDHGNLDWGEQELSSGMYYIYPIRFLSAYLVMGESIVRHHLETLKRRGLCAPFPARYVYSNLWCPGNWHETNCQGWAILPAGEQLHVDWMLEILSPGVKQ